jgi:glycosyltransferase involved in cell wall biosynthesis
LATTDVRRESQRTGQDSLSIVGVAPGDPFDRLTWSGTSFHLFSALDRKGVLVGAVDGRHLPAPIDLVAKALAVHPRKRHWIERYEFSGYAREARGRLGARRAAKIDPRPEVLLQVGAWYEFASRRSLNPHRLASYHDSNLALALRHGFVRYPRGRHVKRMMRAERNVYDGVDVILTMSDWLRRSFVDDFEQPAEKVVTVGAGANLVSYPESVPERSFDVPRFLFVGFAFERKGGDDLLRAFREVRAAEPDARLEIIGPARGRDADGIHWLGPISRDSADGDERIERAFREATAFVMPSRFEPFGVVFLEAMANGLPCIASNACAMPEIVADGTTGRIVPPSDPRTLARAMVELCDPDRARQMGAAGRARFLERFTWDRVVERMLAALDAVGPG